jgi:hypothetical protein
MRPSEATRAKEIAIDKAEWCARFQGLPARDDGA